MLEYVRIDVSEEIDVNKTNGSLKCVISHYLYFLEVNIRFQPNYVIAAIIYCKKL